LPYIAVPYFASGKVLVLLREQVEQILEQHSYLKTGIYLFQQVLQVSIFAKTSQILSTKPIIAINSP